jgi:hypothetical protein
MIRTSRMLGLSCALALTLAAVFATPARACTPICDGGYCRFGVSAVDSCSGRHVCASFCAF